ncbi:MAG: MFS transporter [Candidatus Obscuribacterales bacterium]|nr:MFS transporter [Candidatus Obscuribacterales bacterium]
MSKNLFFVATGMFALGCNTFLLAGLLPQIGQSLGQPVAVSGQAMSIFSLTYLFSAPLFSLLFADKPVKRTVQLALIIFIIGNLITLFSENISLFFLGRALTGVGAGIFTPLCVSIAVHLSAASAKGRALSSVWGANSAGVVFGVPFGLYLSSLFQWQAAIAYIVALSLIALLGFSLQKTDIKLPTSPSAMERLKLLADPKTLSVIGISCLTATASLGLYSFVAVIQSGSPNSLSLTLFSWGLGGFFGSSLVGSFVDRSKNPRAAMAIILLGLTFTIMSIPFARDLPFIGLIPFFLWGVFGWAIPTPQQHILFELHENQGTILAAINSSALGLGAALGTLIGGLIISSGFNESYLPLPAASLLLFVSLAQLLLTGRSNRTNKVFSACTDQ